MRNSAMTLALLVLAMFAAPESAAQTKDPAKHPLSAMKRTTLDSIYTAEQAERGSDVYAMMCRSCHTPDSHTGAVFEAFWQGKKLSDLFVFISERMPKNDPGGLDSTQYADLVAYLLKMNAMPAGKTEIAPDTLALGTVRIELKTKKADAAKHP
jgi:S-disulfanyl-L-cysteine oxidoreductase SoxD